MPSIELWGFVPFLAVPMLSLIFLAKIKSWGITGYFLFIATGFLSFIMLAGASLMMASGFEVVQSNSQSYYNSTGALVGTTTTSNPIINTNQDIYSWILLAFTIVFGFIYFKGVLTGAP